jgi:hypothetical protein
LPEGTYSVKINRRDGVVEIAGADKDWIAAQVDKLAIVYSEQPPDIESGPDTSGEGKASPVQAPRQRRRPRKNPASVGPKEKPDSQLAEKLTTEAHGKLEEFVSARRDHFTSKQDQAAIIATFLQDVLEIEGISAAELSHVYEVMGWRAPVNPRAVINNARERNKYFRGWQDGRAALTVTGLNFGRHDSKQSKDS